MSFKLVRTCQTGGKSYSVLVGGNSQGPPSEAECRCSNAQGPQFSVLQVGQVWLCVWGAGAWVCGGIDA